MKPVLVLLSFFLTVSVMAQSKSWKEMHDFHGVMSATFHPAEENDLKPVKDNAASLTAKAKIWAASAVPQGYNATTAKPILKKLVAKCGELEAAVKAGKADADLKKLITEAHDIFHEIMEKCRDKK
jgi:hypothetical protein